MIQKILNDLDYYKKTPKFTYTIENLEKKIYGTNTLLFETLESYAVLSENLDDQKKKEVLLILSRFLEVSKKKYINKITTTDYDIYEYDEQYKCYIRNKKINIKAIIDLTFKNKIITKVLIDGNSRTFSSWDENFIRDLEKADKIEIWIKK